MPTVLITPESLLGTRGPWVEILEEAGLTVAYPEETTFTRGLVSEAEAVRVMKPASAIIAGGEHFTPSVLAQLPNMRVIARAGVGYDRVNVPESTRRGIAVCITPTANHEGVAEQVFALIFGFAKGVVVNDARTRTGQWVGESTRPIRGKTLGLVGLGRIGQNLAPKARALGLNVVAHTPSGDDRGLGCPMLSLPELLARADYVSLHLPATAQTRHLFRLPQFEQMRPTAWLINTSRGALVHEADLHTALQRRLLAGACLDVFDPEPPDLTQPLFADERVILTPHAAFVSPESLIELRQRVARQVADRLAGRDDHVRARRVDLARVGIAGPPRRRTCLTRGQAAIVVACAGADLKPRRPLDAAASVPVGLARSCAAASRGRPPRGMRSRTWRHC